MGRGRWSGTDRQVNLISFSLNHEKLAIDVYNYLLRRYLYTNDDFIKSGALLAIGLVNCGVRNECDPALALLSDYVLSDNATLRIGAVLGLGLAYAGSQRSDVTELLTGVLADKASAPINPLKL